MAEDFYSCIKLGTLTHDTTTNSLSDEAGKEFLNKFQEKYSKETLNESKPDAAEAPATDTVLLLCETPHKPKVIYSPGDMYHLPGFVIVD